MVAVRRGCYVERELWEASDDDGRYLLSVRSALLATHVDSVASHSSAAVALGIPLRRQWRELVHLTGFGTSGAGGSRTEHGVKHHRAGIGAAHVTTANGLRVTDLARTAVDIGREWAYEDGVVAADAALRLGATPGDLERATEPMTCWPGITRARAAAQVADGGAQNIAETLLRLMVLELGIGRPETQFVVVEDGRRAEVDLRVGRHLFEFDGRVKYVGRAGGGVAERSVEQVLWDEKLREDWLRRAHGGYGMSRVVWREMFGPG